VLSDTVENLGILWNHIGLDPKDVEAHSKQVAIVESKKLKRP